MKTVSQIVKVQMWVEAGVVKAQSFAEEVYAGLLQALFQLIWYLIANGYTGVIQVFGHIAPADFPKEKPPFQLQIRRTLGEAGRDRRRVAVQNIRVRV